jgi:hypothetical protein
MVPLLPLGRGDVKDVVSRVELLEEIAEAD